MVYNQEITLNQFEKLIRKMEKKFQKFENKCIFNSGHIIDNKEGKEAEYDYFTAKEDVEKFKNQFPYVELNIPY